MPVQINITGDNAGQAAAEVLALAGFFSNNAPVPVEKAQPETRRKASAKSEEKPVHQENSAAANQSVEADIEQHLAESDAAEPDSPEPPSDVELRAAASAAGQRVGKVQVKALLDKYEASNVTAVPNEKRAAFLSELEGLK